MRISDQYERFTDRIDKGVDGVAPLAQAKRTGEVAASSGVKETGERRSESGVLSLSLSGRAAELSTGAARVEELKAQIRDGKYKVDAHAIARALVGEELR
jgi:anti-sigma28 factor (negative regulator of flagellin synthesis)